MPQGKLFFTFKLGRNCYKKYKYTSTYINLLKYEVQQLATFSFSVTVFSTVKRIFALLMLPVKAVLHAVSFHMLQVHGCNTCNLYMHALLRRTSSDFQTPRRVVIARRRRAFLTYFEVFLNWRTEEVLLMSI